MSDDENVTRLPVRFKSPHQEEGRSIVVKDGWVDRAVCNHRDRWQGDKIVGVTYAIRDGETEVECGNCGVKLDPMWVLKMLAHKESQWHQTRERYNDEMRRLSERSRTKCEACGHLTRISRSRAK